MGGQDGTNKEGLRGGRKGGREGGREGGKGLSYGRAGRWAGGRKGGREGGRAYLTEALEGVLGHCRSAFVFLAGEVAEIVDEKGDGVVADGKGKFLKGRWGREGREGGEVERRRLNGLKEANARGREGGRACTR